MKNYWILLMTILMVMSCKEEKATADTATAQVVNHFDWDAANLYFLLTDRFKNGDASNDTLINRDENTATLRGFEGGDFAGIQQKIDEGYFTELGINAIWLTPIFEQVRGGVDEGTGFTYAYHGYWAKDWTAVEPAYGTMEEFKALVQAAHKKDIRILLDVVINHTGPVTDQDPQWPDAWVRTGPTCTYQDQETAMSCTLTNNLPDIRTDSKQEVELPPMLVEKWKNEGRYEEELEELEAFFSRTNLPRTPANYVIKWVTDYARETGVDGFRVDTVKHVEEAVWATFIEQSRIAYEEWKRTNKDLVYHNDPFFIVGELYGYYADSGRDYYFNDSPVDYFDSGFDAMINFGFKDYAKSDYQMLFEKYNQLKDSLQLKKTEDPVSFVNYISSHDDGQPFDPMRENALESGTKLLLTPGISQVYYGDETARILKSSGATGDANLRNTMNWDSMNQEVLSHWQALGKFRRDHPAVGAGTSRNLPLDGSGYLSARSYDKNGYQESVVIGVGFPDGNVTLQIADIFKDATQLRNAYTGDLLEVNEGKVNAIAKNGLVLLESVK